MNLTLYYVVGGNDCHYDNLLLSVRSVRKLNKDIPIKIFDFSGKWDYDFDNLEVVHLPDEIDFSKKKIGYLFWRQKYVRALDIDTEYAMYFDTDTSLVQDNFSSILEKIGDGIGSARHWWVPDFSHFRAKAVPPQNLENFRAVCEKLDATEQTPFFAGGVFVFRNNEANRTAMQKVIDVYDEVYTDGTEYARGITDEVFFSGVCENVVDLGGGLNHCSMGEQHMNLLYDDGVIKGKNLYEKDYTPVTFFHCDVSRRDPSEHYEGELKQKIRSLFYE